MKGKLLLLFSLGIITFSNAQCGSVPPPPGLFVMYGLDTDNDGHATFDIQQYIDDEQRPFYENVYGVSSSGYDFVFLSSTNQPLPLLYTNITASDEPHISMVYNNNGPNFDAQPPCFWQPYLASALILFVVPFDQDRDGDGILNADEDTNRNANLMDDDDDADGVINLLDNIDNRLSIKEHNNLQLEIYPNPVTSGSFTFESNISVTAVTIYDLTGKQLLESKINSNAVNVDAISAGVYLLKFQSDNGNIYRKIVINKKKPFLNINPLLSKTVKDFFMPFSGNLFRIITLIGLSG